MTKLLIITCLISLSIFAKVKPTNINKIILPESLKKNFITTKFQKKLSKKQGENLKEKILRGGVKSIPGLTYVMRNKKYPIESRWMATFLLGQVAGKNSISFISKFSKHPDWMQRLASLKTLFSLGVKKSSYYKPFLTDNSMIVRFQALEVVEKLKLVSLAPNVWHMLVDKKNYIVNKNKTVRAKIFKKVIRVLGSLNYKKAKESLLKMAKNSRYDDIFNDLDYSLSRMTNKKSPEGILAKKSFWRSYRL